MALDSIVVLLALILNPIARRRRPRATESATGNAASHATSATEPEQNWELDRINTRGATDADDLSLLSTRRVVSRDAPDAAQRGGRRLKDEEKDIPSKP